MQATATLSMASLVSNVSISVSKASQDWRTHRVQPSERNLTTLFAECRPNFCDGSDEYGGKVKCPNTCRESGKQSTEKRKKKLSTFKDGVIVRNRDVENAHKLRKKHEEELGQLKKEQKSLKSVFEHPYKNLFEKKYRPQITVGLLVEVCSQVTGINAIMFYAPVLFKTIGFGSDASLYSAVIIGAVNVVSTLVAVALVDKYGKKPLLYQAGVQMFMSLVGVAVIFQYWLGLHGHLSKPLGMVVVDLICLFVAGFAWSWGPLSWLIPSEIFPLEIRPAALSMCVAMNLFWTFLIGQCLLTLFCAMEYGIFLPFRWLCRSDDTIFRVLPSRDQECTHTGYRPLVPKPLVLEEDDSN